jgi:hypothetical protein
MFKRKSGQDKLDRQIEAQLELSQLLLLKAEGELENAQATVDVLRKRVSRLSHLLRGSMPCEQAGEPVVAERLDHALHNRKWEMTS